MAEGNGKSLITFVGSIIAGVLAIVVIIYNLVYAPLSCAINQERVERNADVNSVVGKLDKILSNTEQIKISQAITSKQVEINTKRLDVLERQRNYVSR